MMLPLFVLAICCGSKVSADMDMRLSPRDLKERKLLEVRTELYSESKAPRYVWKAWRGDRF